MGAKIMAYVEREDTGERVAKGDTVTNFRGEAATFDGISREPGGNSEGKILTSRPCGHAPGEHGPGTPIFWCDGQDRGEYYPTGYGLVIKTDAG
jgi:hypothetical protein